MGKKNMNTDDAYNKIATIVTGLFYNTYTERMEAIEAVVEEWNCYD